MSTNRISRNAGWREARVDEQGRRRCRWCDKPVSGRRRNWCSQACIDEHSIRSNPGFARRKTFERDHGVCATCGLDTEALRRSFEQERDQERDMRAATMWFGSRLAPESEARIAAAERQLDRYRMMWTHNGLSWSAAVLREMGFRVDRWHVPALWHMDHIVPVVEGGGECGLENLRTLCVPCHNRETAALARRRAAARRGQDSLDLDGAA